MHWHFSPVEVATGSVIYRLADFRRDLMQRIESSFHDLDEGEIQGLFNLNYLMLYWLATENPFEEFVAEFERQLRPVPWIHSYLTLVHEKRCGDIAMLSAILLRMARDSVEAGCTPASAWDRTFENHAKISSQPQPTSRNAGIRAQKRLDSCGKRTSFVVAAGSNLYGTH